MISSIFCAIWVLRVQQIQPFVKGTILLVSVILAPLAINFSSTLTSPMSLTMTATLKPFWLLRT